MNNDKQLLEEVFVICRSTELISEELSCLLGDK